MKESEGVFGDAMPSSRPCPQCGKMTVTFRIWESNCGGYEDIKFECRSLDCGHHWWIDGADA